MPDTCQFQHSLSTAVNLRYNVCNISTCERSALMKDFRSVTFLPCSDIKATAQFYRDILKLRVRAVQGDNLYIFDTGYGYWGFCQYRDGRKPLSGDKGVCLSLNLGSDEEVMEVYRHIKEICRIYREPAVHPNFPVYSFFILDPDGYLVEIQHTALV